MEEQRKNQQPDDTTAREQDGSLKNSDKHGHWYQVGQQVTDRNKHSDDQTEQDSATQQTGTHPEKNP